MKVIEHATADGFDRAACLALASRSIGHGISFRERGATASPAVSVTRTIARHCDPAFSNGCHTMWMSASLATRHATLIPHQRTWFAHEIPSSRNSVSAPHLMKKTARAVRASHHRDEGGLGDRAMLPLGERAPGVS